MFVARRQAEQYQFKFFFFNERFCYKLQRFQVFKCQLDDTFSPLLRIQGNKRHPFPFTWEIREMKSIRVLMEKL